MWASTHNVDLQEKMSAVVSALSDCQNKIGTGYLSAFPPELFDRFESLKEVWAPYYTIHKVQVSNYNSNASYLIGVLLFRGFCRFWLVYWISIPWLGVNEH